VLSPVIAAIETERCGPYRDAFGVFGRMNESHSGNEIGSRLYLCEDSRVVLLGDPGVNKPVT
jgi:hypothetical protein